MIYVTVGSYPAGFDRLIQYVDDLVALHPVECVAQIAGGSYVPENFRYQRFFNSSEQNDFIKSAQFVISHGGFGVIGDIIRMGKPMIVVPRPPEEGPNDQRPVARRLASQFGFPLCESFAALQEQFMLMMASDTSSLKYQLDTDIPETIADFLRTL